MNLLTTLKTTCIDALFVRYSNIDLAFARQSKTQGPLRTIIENPLNTILVSQLSLMEMSIKLKLGKLPEFIVSIEYIAKQLLLDGFELLQASNNHIFSYQQIPFYEDHRDPFDRLLLATALSEQIPIISIDENFPRYRPLVTVID